MKFLSLSADTNQALRLCLGNKATGADYGAVSALSINHDCSRLLCGFAKGQVHESVCPSVLLLVSYVFVIIKQLLISLQQKVAKDKSNSDFLINGNIEKRNNGNFFRHEKDRNYIKSSAFLNN